MASPQLKTNTQQAARHCLGRTTTTGRQLQRILCAWLLRITGSFSCKLWTTPALLLLQYLYVWGVEISQRCQSHRKTFGTVGDPKPLQDGGRYSNFFTQPLKKKRWVRSKLTNMLNYTGQILLGLWTSQSFKTLTAVHKIMWQFATSNLCSELLRL